MLSTQWLTYLVVLSSEIASDWKLSFIKLTFSFRVTRLLGLNLLAHRVTKPLFSVAQELNLFAQTIRPGFFLVCGSSFTRLAFFPPRNTKYSYSLCVSVPRDKNPADACLQLVIYEFFLCSANILHGLSAYKP